MSRVPVPLAVAVLLGLILSGVSAQSAESDAEAAEPPSTEKNVLFAHGTGKDEFLGFMNTLEQDGDDASMGSGQYLNSAKTWTFHLEPNLTTGLLLDETKTLDAYAYMGSTSNVGRLSVTTQVSSGDDLLAKGESKTLTVTAGYTLLTWNMKVLNTTIHPDTNLTWTIRASGIATGTLLGTGDTRKSNITLPIIGPAEGAEGQPPTVFTDISTVRIDETLEFENATDAHYQFNWTLEGDQGVAGELVVDGTGNVSLTAVDGSGTEVINVNTTGSGSSGGNSSTGSGTRNGTSIPLDAADAAPGYWMVNVTVANFAGTVILSLGPVVDDVNATTSPNATATPTRGLPRTSAAATTTPTAATNETAEARGVPGVAALAGLATLSIAALAWRRRQT